MVGAAVDLSQRVLIPGAVHFSQPSVKGMFSDGRPSMNLRMACDRVQSTFLTSQRSGSLNGMAASSAVQPGRLAFQKGGIDVPNGHPIRGRQRGTEVGRYMSTAEVASPVLKRSGSYRMDGHFPMNDEL